MHKLLVLAIISLIVFTPVVFAFDYQVKRTQTVYSVLDWEGKVLDTSIVNWIRIEGKGKLAIEDNPGIENVTTLDPELRPEVKGNKLIWNVLSDGIKDIFYTGKTQKALPLKINIVLKKDGIVTNPELIIGKSGKIELSIEFENLLSSKELLTWKVGSQLKSEEKIIYQPMTIIIQADFPVESFDTLESAKSLSMTVGSHKKLVWTLFPKPKDKIELVYTSQTISIPSIQISIQPIIPNIEIPSIDENMIDLMGIFSGDDEIFDLLTNGVPFDSKKSLVQINKTKNLMDASKSIINDSNKQLTEFVTAFSSLENGLREIQKGSTQLIDLSKGHKLLLETINTNFGQNQEGFVESIKGVEDAVNSTGKVSRDMFTLKSQLEEIKDSISKIKPSIQDKDVLDKIDQIQLTAINAISKVDNLKSEQDKALTILKTLINGGIINGKDIPALSSMPESLDLLTQALKALIGGGQVMGQEIPGLDTTINGLSGISDGLKTIIQGGEVEGKKTPPLSSIPALVSQSSSKMKVLVDGGKLDGLEIPSQNDTLLMIEDFKKMLIDFEPMQAKLDETSKKLDEIIKKAGSKENLIGSIKDTQDLLFSGTVELDKMKEKEKLYKTFVGDMPNADKTLLFVLKLKEYSLNDKINNHNITNTSKDDNPYSDINKYKYYLLFGALFLLISSFVVNWLVLRRKRM